MCAFVSRGGKRPPPAPFRLLPGRPETRARARLGECGRLAGPLRKASPRLGGAPAPWGPGPGRRTRSPRLRWGVGQHGPAGSGAYRVARKRSSALKKRNWKKKNLGKRARFRWITPGAESAARVPRSRADLSTEPPKTGTQPQAARAGNTGRLGPSPGTSGSLGGASRAGTGYLSPQTHKFPGATLPST